MMGGSSVLSSAVLKSSETSASCGGEEISLTPDSLPPLRLGVCEDKGEACVSKLTLEPCEDELAMLPPPLPGLITQLKWTYCPTCGTGSRYDTGYAAARRSHVTRDV